MKATAIIPTKSNFTGLVKIVETLESDSAIETIVVLADGYVAYNTLKETLSIYTKTKLYVVVQGSGIHNMWNLGLEIAHNNRTHAFFINDDVESDPDCATVLCNLLDSQSSIGLLCPNYDGREILGDFQYVDTTCGGRYDGSGGLAGFYMAFHADLVPHYRFDERMKWYYGDDDILSWTLSQNKNVAITATTNCWGNQSQTIVNDPPPNFAEQIENDRAIYELLRWTR
jgi:hypothetical protein